MDDRRDSETRFLNEEHAAAIVPSLPQSGNRIVARPFKAGSHPSTARLSAWRRSATHEPLGLIGSSPLRQSPLSRAQFTEN
jgi:hypothetical protein